MVSDVGHTMKRVTRMVSDVGHTMKMVTRMVSYVGHTMKMVTCMVSDVGHTMKRVTRMVSDVGHTMKRVTRLSSSTRTPHLGARRSWKTRPSAWPPSGRKREQRQALARRVIATAHSGPHASQARRHLQMALRACPERPPQCPPPRLQQQQQQQQRVILVHRWCRPSPSDACHQREDYHGLHSAATTTTT
jgi:hypothetical protein